MHIRSSSLFLVAILAAQAVAKSTVTFDYANPKVISVVKNGEVSTVERASKLALDEDNGEFVNLSVLNVNEAVFDVKIDASVEAIPPPISLDDLLNYFKASGDVTSAKEKIDKADKIFGLESGTTLGFITDKDVILLDKIAKYFKDSDEIQTAYKATNPKLFKDYLGAPKSKIDDVVVRGNDLSKDLAEYIKRLEAKLLELEAGKESEVVLALESLKNKSTELTTAIKQNKLALEWLSDRANFEAHSETKMVDANRIIFSVSIKPKKDVKADPIEFTIVFEGESRPGNMYFGIGALYGFRSQNPGLTSTTDQMTQVTTYKITLGESSDSKLFVHSGYNFAISDTVGWFAGVGLAQEAGLGIVTGLNFAVSDDRRVGISLGLTAFQFKRLATGYKENDPFTGGTVVPTQDVTRVTFFLGMTYRP